MIGNAAAPVVVKSGAKSWVAERRAAARLATVVLAAVALEGENIDSSIISVTTTKRVVQTHITNVTEQEGEL